MYVQNSHKRHATLEARNRTYEMIAVKHVETEIATSPAMSKEG